MNDSDSWARADEASFQEPGQAQTHQDVEDITSDGVTDGHVSVTLLDHGHSWQTVGHADPGCDEGEAHHGVRDAQGEPDDGDHPDHHVAGTFTYKYKTEN